MFKLISRLRKKSLAERKIIALTISASITSIIFFVWISTFLIKSPLSKSDSENARSSFINITPISSIKENVASVYSNFVKFLMVGKVIQVENETKESE